jgi:type I restriction enzyme S subunit
MSSPNLPKHWVARPFLDTVKRFQSKGGKLTTSEYQQAGSLPIVDQGQSQIAAFTIDEDRAFQGPYPVIVFGDHTRTAKLIDFKFAVGADGVVLLRPSDEMTLDVSFLFYWLKYVPLHNLGYSRHFKLLSDAEISFPADINEQHRIVKRIEELTQRIEEAEKFAGAREAGLDTMLQAYYARLIKGAEWSPLSEIASLVRRPIKTKPEEQYEEMGIRSFGKGTFKKPVLTGKQIGNKRIYRIHEGDLVFSNVFAWEKAIAVAKKEDHGRVGSHRFITYVPHKGKATSEFLCHHFLSERGIEDIRTASPGSAGRNCTLGLRKLDEIMVPVPDYEEQVRFSEIAKRRQLVQMEAAGIMGDMKLFNAALIAKAFRGEL